MDILNSIKQISSSYYSVIPIVIILIISGVVIGLRVRKSNYMEYENKLYIILACIFWLLEITKYVDKGILGVLTIRDIPVAFSAMPLFVFTLMPFVKSNKRRNVLRMFSGPFLLFIGLLFFISPNTIAEAESITILLQTVVWHYGVLFLGVIFTVIHKIYTFKWTKIFYICLLIVLLVILLSFILNYIFKDINLDLLFNGVNYPVYPVTSIFLQHTEPYIIYYLVHSLLAIVACNVCFYVLVGIGKVSTIIANMKFK